MSKLLSIGVFISLFFGLISASCREVAEKSSLEEISLEGAIEGTVTMKFSEDGCDVLISTIEGLKNVYFIPVELDPKFKVEGMEVLFTSHPSRINQGNCLMGSPIVIDSIVAR